MAFQIQPIGKTICRPKKRSRSTAGGSEGVRRVPKLELLPADQLPENQKTSKSSFTTCSTTSDTSWTMTVGSGTTVTALPGDVTVWEVGDKLFETEEAAEEYSLNMMMAGITSYPRKKTKFASDRVYVGSTKYYIERHPSEGWRVMRIHVDKADTVAAHCISRDACRKFIANNDRKAYNPHTGQFVGVGDDVTAATNRMIEKRKAIARRADGYLPGRMNPYTGTINSKGDDDGMIDDLAEFERMWESNNATEELKARGRSL